MGDNADGGDALDASDDKDTTYTSINNFSIAALLIHHLLFHH